MNDRPDRFDRDLADRLRAHEHRVAGGAAPRLDKRAADRRSLVAAVSLTAAGVVTAVVAGAMLTSRPPAASSSPAASVTSSPARTSPATPPTSDLAWTEVASFPADPELVIRINDAASWAGGIVAVGTQYPSGYEGELDPQGGRVWTSVDGRQWNDLTPDHAFDGVDLTHIYEAADGSLILLGLTNQETETRYWRSTDTRNWQELKDLGLPSGLLVLYAEHGSRGYLIAGGESGVGWTLWFSTDGLSWDRVWTEPDDRATREFIHGIAAGNAGFAAKGVAVANMVGEWFLLTSPDGREWAAPPEARDWGGFKLTSHNGGWVAVATHEFYGGPYVPPAPARPTVWISADGVSWTDVLELTVQPPTLDGDPRCRTGVPELTSAGPWIVMSTGFSCWYGGEGLSPVVEAYGTPRISTDGVHWQPLPFSEFSYDPVAHEAIDAGSIIRVAVAIDGDLLLGGESNGKVTFWLGEAP